MNDTTTFLYAVAAFTFLIMVFLVTTYNKIARLKNLVRESWSDVDVALKRRYDLIPNLVDTAKAYAAHEQSLFTEIAVAREHASVASGSIDEREAQEKVLVSRVNTLLGRVESYPQIKSNEQFLAIQVELVNTEDRIAAARRFYNANVRDYNTLLCRFPTGAIAKMNGFVEAPYFDVEGLNVDIAPTVSA